MPIDVVEVQVVGPQGPPGPQGQSGFGALREVEATSSTSITASDADHGKLIQLTAITPVEITLPAGVTPGVQIEYQATDAGLGTFVLGAGAVWRPEPVPSSIMLDIGSAVTAMAVDVNTWMLVGRLA
jgi:hypothetical protein